MNIIIVHNRYQQTGGEDAAVAAEAAMLAQAGHKVRIEQVSNHAIDGLAAKAGMFLRAPHDATRRTWMHALLDQSGAELVHVHNFFPLLTPAIHDAAAERGIAVVQTLHNYRTICAGALLMRSGQPCEKCIHGTRLWGIAHRCYRGSLAGSLAVARMQSRAFARRTWARSVHRFIALTEFARGKFMEARMPGARIVVKPNVVADPGQEVETARHGALYIGRLAPEKGVHTLIQAWREVVRMPLTIVGTGPEERPLRAMAHDNIEFTGHLGAQAVQDRLCKAALLIVPSLWYEGMPMVILEAFAQGVPVLAADIGALKEMVTPGVNGALFAPGKPEQLVQAVQTLTHEPGTLARLGRGARGTYEALYAPARNLAQLEDIYRQAMAQATSDQTMA